MSLSPADYQTFVSIFRINGARRVPTSWSAVVLALSALGFQLQPALHPDIRVFVPPEGLPHVALLIPEPVGRPFLPVELAMLGMLLSGLYGIDTSLISALSRSRS
ncbi:hypothetical protein C8Q76DRAFT_799855 [Earliella scabrosa]|nr:hypothetical protein C8Q76DRAFT_799855 [Earliella scabrosa]